MEYVPFGEVFIEERNATWRTPYKFNGKELDEETGLYYYGARYYEPRTGLWLSVDPLAEKYPGVSSYVYCVNNPVMLVDPDGRVVETAWDLFSLATGAASLVDNIQNRRIGAAIVDGLGIVVDGLAVIFPLVPGGAGAGISAVRAADKAMDVAKATDKVADTRQIKSSKSARREVMREEGIPTSQQPYSQSKNVSGREYSYKVPKEGGGTQTKSVQQQTMDRNHNEFHWEAGTVKIRDGQIQFNKFSRPKLENGKSKVNY